MFVSIATTIEPDLSELVPLELWIAVLFLRNPFTERTLTVALQCDPWLLCGAAAEYASLLDDACCRPEYYMRCCRRTDIYADIGVADVDANIAV